MGKSPWAKACGWGKTPWAGPGPGLGRGQDPGPSLLGNFSRMYHRSEGFPRTAYFVPGRDGIGVWPDSEIVRSAAAAASSLACRSLTNILILDFLLGGGLRSVRIDPSRNCSIDEARIKPNRLARTRNGPKPSKNIKNGPKTSQTRCADQENHSAA